MTSIRQRKKEDLKTGKVKLPTKEQRNERLAKKNNAHHQASEQKRIRKFSKTPAPNKRFQNELKQDFIDQQHDEYQEVNPDFKLYAEETFESDIIVEEKAAPLKKKKRKKIYTFKNPIALDFSQNGDISQGYSMTWPRKDRYVLQTFVGGMPIISETQAEKLRDSIGIKNKKSTRRREFYKTINDVLSRGEKSNSLAITTIINKNFQIEDGQVLSHQHNVSYHFSKKDDVAKLIHNPILNKAHHNLHFNRLAEFSKNYCISFGRKDFFIQELNKQENLPKDIFVNLTPDEMIEELKKNGHIYQSDEEITAEIFKDIQNADIELINTPTIPHFKEIPLSPDEMMGTLRAFTNKGVAVFFEKEKIPNISFTTNPKNNQKFTKSIIPINNPLEDPRAAFNATQLQYYLQTGDILFSQEQATSITSAGLNEKTSWSSSNQSSNKKVEMKLVS